MAVRTRLHQDQRIEFRIGVHLGDVVEESDGDLMGRRRQYRGEVGGNPKPGRFVFPRRLPASESTARSRHRRSGSDAAKEHCEPIRVYSLEVDKPLRPSAPKNPPRRASRSWFCRSPISEAARSRSLSSRRHGEPDNDLSRFEGRSLIARNTRSPTRANRST